MLSKLLKNIFLANFVCQNSSLFAYPIFLLVGFMLGTYIFANACPCEYNSSIYTCKTALSTSSVHIFIGNEFSLDLSQKGKNYHSYTFIVSANQTIDSKLNTKGFDTFLILLTPSGEVKFHDGSREFSELEMLAQESGNYTVFVTSYERLGSDEKGNYELKVEIFPKSQNNPLESCKIDESIIEIEDKPFIVEIGDNFSEDDSGELTENLQQSDLAKKLKDFSKEDYQSSGFLKEFCPRAIESFVCSSSSEKDTACDKSVEVITQGDLNAGVNKEVFKEEIREELVKSSFNKVKDSYESDLRDRFVLFSNEDQNVMSILLYYPNGFVSRKGFCLAELKD